MHSTNDLRVTEPAGLYVVSVRDTINRERAEHTGATYDSPPQAREQGSR
jgi:hypothetical protein